MLGACAPGPRGADAFAGPPLRTGTLDNEVTFEVFAEGSGPDAGEGDWVALHWALYLPDGTPAGGSLARGPLRFLLLDSNEVVEGLQHGIVGMREGELRRVIVPPRLGYQNRRIGNIPPGSTLRFDLEMIEIVDLAEGGSAP
jgi:FKBP-type peptidyl-prolyl cis-trans isomerase